MNLIDNYKNKRRLSKTDLASLSVMAESLEAECEGLERFIRALDTEAWQGIIRYLSGRLQEIEHARSEISPEDVVKQSMAQGQANEIKLLTFQLENAKKQLAEKTEVLSDVRARMAPTEK